MPQKRVLITYFNSLPFRHWSLYIKHGANDFEEFQVNGVQGSYEYDTRKTTNPNQISSYLETVQLGSVSTNNIDRFRTAASEQEIRRHWNWNCQNWIMNLLLDLMAQGIIDVPDRTMEKLKKDRQSLDDRFDPDHPHRMPTPE